ncbi:hypothetical protein HNR33_002740 [Brassicibacter mesophilus]
MGDSYFGRFIGKSQRSHMNEMARKVNEAIYVDNSMCVNCKLYSY